MVEDIFQTIYNNILLYSPNLLSALILVFIGIIIGRILGKVVEVIIERFKIENIIFKKRIIGLPTIFSFLVSWSIYLIFLKEGIDLFGIIYISKILDVIITFLGKFFIFLIFFLAGVGISVYLEDQIKKSDIEFRNLVSKAVLYSGIYITLVLTLPIFGIDTTLLSWLFIVVIASFLIPFSFGISLALKDEMKSYFRKYFKRRA